MFAIDVSNISKRYGDSEILSDISFQIKPGETVGVIGPNGAGKSTLLKILSSIVRPTSGRIELNGTVASILEIGMGFHPELTGMENIFFAGQMMGYSKSYIEQRLQQIIDFSELADHMDKMVKFYSSGMYLRLAFSVFSLLESDILILDEVLSVGDASFRRKSFEWMADYKARNKTILLVSHNLGEVQNFCDRVIYIDRTIKKDSTNIRSCILAYQRDHPDKHLTEQEVPSGDQSENAQGHSLIQKRSAEVELPGNDFLDGLKVHLNCDGKEHGPVFFYDDEIQIVLNYNLLVQGMAVSFIIKVYDINDELLLTTAPVFNKEAPEGERSFLVGSYEEKTTIPRNFLNVGRYYLTLMVGIDYELVHAHDRILHFDIEQSEWTKGRTWANIPSPILTSFKWEKKMVDQPGGEEV